MPNINLKFIIVAVILLSILIIVGSLIFTFLGKPKAIPLSPPSTDTQESPQLPKHPEAQSSGGGSGE